jgi:hypothetical protein
LLLPLIVAALKVRAGCQMSTSEFAQHITGLSARVAVLRRADMLPLLASLARAAATPTDRGRRWLLSAACYE